MTRNKSCQIQGLEVVLVDNNGPSIPLDFCFKHAKHRATIKFIDFNGEDAKLVMRLCDDHFHMMRKLHGNADPVPFDDHGRTRQVRYHFKEHRL